MQASVEWPLRPATVGSRSGHSHWTRYCLCRGRLSRSPTDSLFIMLTLLLSFAELNIANVCHSPMFRAGSRSEFSKFTLYRRSKHQTPVYLALPIRSMRVGPYHKCSSVLLTTPNSAHLSHFPSIVCHSQCFSTSFFSSQWSGRGLMVRVLGARVVGSIPTLVMVRF